MIGYFIISVSAAFGAALTLVEKQREWPVRRIYLLLKLYLKSLHPRLPRMLQCGACTSFWIALIFDVFLLVISGGHYWTWPLSGFAAAGLSFVITDFLNTLSKQRFIYTLRDKPNDE